MPDTVTAERLSIVACVLIRSFLLAFLLLLLWALCYALLPGPIYSQAAHFGLAAHEVDVINYCGMAFVKLCALLFFLFPYIAIRLVARRIAQ